MFLLLGGQTTSYKIDEFRRKIHVRLPKPRQRVLKIEQPMSMRVGQDAQCTGYTQIPAHGFGAPVPIVDQEDVGVERKGEGDGCAFAGIERRQRGIERRIW